MTIALALGLVGMVDHHASNPMFEMLDLAQRHAAAGTAGERNLLLAAGHATLARMTGTAFDAYYVLSAIAMLGASSAGTLGLIFAFASPLPWTAFAILVGLHLLHLK